MKSNDAISFILILLFCIITAPVGIVLYYVYVICSLMFDS